MAVIRRKNSEKTLGNLSGSYSGKAFGLSGLSFGIPRWRWRLRRQNRDQISQPQIRVFSDLSIAFIAVSSSECNGGLPVDHSPQERAPKNVVRRERVRKPVDLHPGVAQIYPDE